MDQLRADFPTFLPETALRLPANERMRTEKKRKPLAQNQIWEDPHKTVQFRNKTNILLHFFVRSAARMCEQWNVYEKPFICSLTPLPHDDALRRRCRDSQLLRI
jgi:hypothetical protein